MCVFIFYRSYCFVYKFMYCILFPESILAGVKGCVSLLCTIFSNNFDTVGSNDIGL